MALRQIILTLPSPGTGVAGLVLLTPKSPDAAGSVCPTLDPFFNGPTRAGAVPAGLSVPTVAGRAPPVLVMLHVTCWAYAMLPMVNMMPNKSIGISKRLNVI